MGRSGEQVFGHEVWRWSRMLEWTGTLNNGRVVLWVGAPIDLSQRAFQVRFSGMLKFVLIPNYSGANTILNLKLRQFATKRSRVMSTPNCDFHYPNIPSFYESWFNSWLVPCWLFYFHINLNEYSETWNIGVTWGTEQRASTKMRFLMA